MFIGQPLYNDGNDDDFNDDDDDDDDESCTYAYTSRAVVLFYIKYLLILERACTSMQRVRERGVPACTRLCTLLMHIVQ